MVTKGGVWFLVLAFLGFVLSPDHAGAKTVPFTLNVLTDMGIESLVPEDNVGICGKEGFSVVETLQLAQADEVQAAPEESTGTGAEDRESTTESAPKKEGPSTAARISIVLVSFVLVALLVVAAGAGGGFGGFSGLNLNFGK